jgi:hypothetical protein
MRLIAPDAVAIGELLAHGVECETLPLREIEFHEVSVNVQGWTIVAPPAKDRCDNLRSLQRTAERAADDRVDILGCEILASLIGCGRTPFTQNWLVTTPLISLLNIERTLGMSDNEHPSPTAVIGY